MLRLWYSGIAIHTINLMKRVLQVRDDDDECDSLCAAAPVLLWVHLTRSGGLSVPQITKDFRNSALLCYSFPPSLVFLNGALSRSFFLSLMYFTFLF